MFVKIKEHVKRNKLLYIGIGVGSISTLGYVLVSQRNTDTPLQVIKQIAFRAEANPTIVQLVERSTPSKPVHLVGTNLYFASLSEAARETGHSLTQISKQVNGHLSNIQGDVFELLEKAA